MKRAADYLLLLPLPAIFSIVAVDELTEYTSAVLVLIAVWFGAILGFALGRLASEPDHERRDTGQGADGNAAIAVLTPDGDSHDGQRNDR